MPDLKETLKKLLLGYNRFTPSFSQAGEDMILRSIFRKVFDGYFVDIGAYHPVIGSNTYYFYRFMGWTGINIEPNPDHFPEFTKARTRDINLNMGVSAGKQELQYYMVDKLPAMNTFSEAFLVQNHMREHVSRVIPVQTDSLKNILDRYNSGGRPIDLMNVDVEGLDIDVLESNDWAKYRPKCIVIEVNNEEIQHGPIHALLTDKGYILKGLTPVNTQINASCIYLDAAWAKAFSNY